MQLILINILGFVATGIIGFSLVPQVYKTFRDKKADDLSMSSLVLQNISNVMFIVYGYFINSLPIIICNGIILVCSSLLIYAKSKYKVYTIIN
tara:strand:- start:692 stop:970 length:279 start_codon:yes stop_codon:yes gene_type:complete